VSPACQVARRGCSRRYSSTSQTWPPSQTGNKANGICSVCHATRQIHLKDWTIHRYGPHNQPCPDSHKPPLGPSNVSVPCQTPVALQSSASSSQISTPAAAAATDQSEAHPDWFPPDCAFIRHIPKAARPAQKKQLRIPISRPTGKLC